MKAIKFIILVVFITLCATSCDTRSYPELDQPITLEQLYHKQEQVMWKYDYMLEVTQCSARAIAEVYVEQNNAGKMSDSELDKKMEELNEISRKEQMSIINRKQRVSDIHDNQINAFVRRTLAKK